MASKEALDLKALASERFWENKAECDDAEKKYVLSLNSAKVDEEVSLSSQVPESQGGALASGQNGDSDIDFFASDDESTPGPKAKPQFFKVQPKATPKNGGSAEPKQGKSELSEKGSKVQGKVEVTPTLLPVSHPNKERTFLMLKPDAVQRGLAGNIIARFEKKGFKLVAMKVMLASTDLLKQHYADLSKKPFFPELIRYMASGPVLPMVWEGLNVVKTGRVMLGETNPKDSAPGTIRGDYCIDIGRNIIHGSDSVESANKEISLWFLETDLVAWRPCHVEWIYEDEVPDDADILDKMVSDKLASLESEHKALKKANDDLRNLILSLEKRVATLEGGKPTGKPVSAPAKEDDDEDVDLFGSSDDDEDDEKAKVREERLKAYAEKKSKKPALIAKTSVLLDVKPWDDETDMTKMLESVKTIEKDGLVWGASKLVPVGYGINKLQVMCVVEDEKVSIDELCEQIQEFEDYVQSVDIAAMSKI